MVALETPRLRLLPLSLADAPAIQRIFPQWEIVRWLSVKVPWPYPNDGAELFLRNIVLPEVEAGKAWHWGIRRKDNPEELIGSISLMENLDNNRGFWIDPAWQGAGLMTEACEVVTDFWFHYLGKHSLRVPKAVSNDPSRRISEKQGMRVVSRYKAEMVSGHQDMELWEISREDWLTRRQSAIASV